MTGPRRVGRTVGRALASALVVGLVLVSCDAPTGHQVVDGVTLLRQAHAGDEYPAGLGIGTLVVESGCVALDGLDGVAYVVWMPAVELRDGDDGLEVVVGDQAAAIGDDVEIGGGYRDLASIEGLTADGIPEPCRTRGDERYFIFGGGLTSATERPVPDVPLGVPEPSPWPIEPGQARDRPKSPDAPTGEPQPFRLYTHCGVDFRVDFDGSFWQSYEYVGDAPADPFQRGTMTLLAGNVAVFEMRAGGAIYFVRNDSPKPTGACW